MDSLYTLEDVSGSFVIQAAGSLTSLSGLEHLAFAENLQIRNNALITDIGAIDSNIQVESFLEIWNNSELENCDEVWVCRALECVGFYRIENNKGDCALEYNVVTSCPCVAGTEVIDLTFTSQGQIDSFPLLFQQCPVQVRNIDIADVNDITNLDSLYPITEIGEDLVLEELPRLKDLSGLRNVIGVGGSITIELCDSLTSLDGLQNIDQLYDLNIIENALLTSIAEMDSFINVISDLSIYANPLLETCNVFWLCRNLGFEFNSVDVSDNGTGCIEKSDFISGCYCVVNPLRAEVELNTQAQVDSFPVLYQSCGVKPLSLLIIGNGILNLDSLYQIDSLLNLDIFGCDSLVDLSGLSNLQYVENEIEFTNNDILEDISALHPDLKVNSIRLINNDSLNTCDVAWVCKAIERGAQYFINNNASDCADEETVAYACVCSGLADTLDVSLSTQSEVDMFASFYDQCDFKIRSLDVDAASNQYISNLDSLIAIDSIYGTLNLETLAPPDSLLDLSGLQNLVYVKGDFRLEQINISDLSDFENIQYVGGDIIILENDQLEDMAGLDATLRIDGDV